jgi:hypothetical protein
MKKHISLAIKNLSLRLLEKIKNIPTLHLFLCLVGLLIYLNFDYLNNLLVLKFFGYKNEFHLKLPDIDYKSNAKYRYKGKVKSVKWKWEIKSVELYSYEKEYDNNGNIISDICIFSSGKGTKSLYKYSSNGNLEYSERYNFDFIKEESKYYYYNRVGNLVETVSLRNYLEGNIEHKDTSEHIKFSYVDYPDEDLVKVIKKDEDDYVLKIDYYKYDQLNSFQEAYIDNRFYYFNGHNYLATEYDSAIYEYDYNGNQTFQVNYANGGQNNESQRVVSALRQKYARDNFVSEAKYYFWEERLNENNLSSWRGIKSYKKEVLEKNLLNFRNLIEGNESYKYTFNPNGNPFSVEFFQDGKRVIDFSLYEYDSYDGNIIYDPTDSGMKEYSFEYYE